MSELQAGMLQWLAAALLFFVGYLVGSMHRTRTSGSVIGRAIDRDENRPYRGHWRR